MKKRFITFALLILGGVFLSYGHTTDQSELLSFQVERVKPTKPIGGLPRTPIAQPEVSQDDYTLYFNNVGYDLTLVLIDEDGEEAYTVFVPANTTSVVLPSTLSGDYELQLYPDDSVYYFYADITL